ncbi:M20/M25/M40 family metallo-hydrolase [Paramaledivibacter caminithermalis]|uniref:Arginine utilization protein RocB n=1 Tax=Paramaledivibacter caminithermalis (strain DSM 15212 / CIP 107654 / DViRD3) TaxID=1121301 RepID=A0A1M6K469_PARC5|nr:M20/M25/M40 family metallo-hydrolase [Paramaledivibacter caminithermalis]SHJ53739.1 Arginine utilization protein RocB [Paramaledivibacter caminithermalis DSM 15212]
MPLKNTKEEIYSFLMKFCEIRSVTDSEGEKLAPKFIYDELKKLTYFKDNPEDLFIQEIGEDRLKRSNLCAFVRSKKQTMNTIILMGHLDVVDTDVCGNLRDLAFYPQVYTKEIAKIDIPKEAREDLESGDWIFGRGVADMKSGLAVQAGLVAELSENTDNLDVNILYLAVADEENNACGIHKALELIEDMKEKGYKFLCCIDSEPTITQLDKGAGWIHLGTIGMYTPFTFVLGRETHVGEYFEGLSAALIAFKLGNLIEGSDEFADNFKDVVYPPLTCLKIKDLKPTYSVTVIERMAMYYNVLFVQRTPDEILAALKKAASCALEKSIAEQNMKRLTQGTQTKEKILKGRIIEYNELISLAADQANEDIQKLIEAYLRTLSPKMELQERGMMLVNHLIDIAKLKGPAVIVGFLPPYCPALYNERKTKRELDILDTVEEIIGEAEKTFSVKIHTAEIYEGISDLSEFGFKGSKRDEQVLAKNMPGWGMDFVYPFHRSKNLDIPVLNIGPIGKDAHKLTERLYLPYALEVLPFLLKKIVLGLAKRAKLQ